MGVNGGVARPVTGRGQPPPLEEGGRRALADVDGASQVGGEARELQVTVRGEGVVVFRLGVHVRHHRLVRDWGGGTAVAVVAAVEGPCGSLSHHRVRPLCHPRGGA